MFEKKMATKLLVFLMQTYRLLTPPLLVAGLFAASIIALKTIVFRSVDSLGIAALAAWTLVVTRMVLLALVDASSFTVITFQYALPVMYLAALAAILSVAAFLHLTLKSILIKSRHEVRA